MAQPSLAGGTATLVVRRANEWTARLRRYVIFVDDQKIGGVGNDEAVTFPVAPGTHAIRVSLDWSKSEVQTFTVQAGETVHFGTHWKLGVLGGKPVVEQQPAG